MFSEFVAYRQQYAVKGKNNAILLLEQASKYFALSKNLTNRRLTSNEGYMKWTMYDIYLYIMWYTHTYIHIYDHVYHIVIYTHQNIIQIYLCTCIYNIIHRYIYIDRYKVYGYV